MPISNLNNTHLSQTQIDETNNALALLEKILGIFLVNLTDKERQKYGSINEQNKLFVNKVKDFQKSNPELATEDVKWEEFAYDYEDRIALESILNRLQSLVLGLDNAKILHDNDNYNDALDDYEFTTYKAGGNKPGFEHKYKELKQFFSKKSRNEQPQATNEETK